MDIQSKDSSVDNLLFGYFAGQLTVEEEQQLLEWLRADESHKRVFSEKADQWATAYVPLFQSGQKENFDAQFAKLISAASLKEKRFSLRMYSWWSVAAFLVVVVVAGSLFYQAAKHIPGTFSEVVPPPEAAGYELTTLYGSVSKLRLPDGTQAWVNAGSTLKYTSDYNKQNRTVELNGEAYFEVHPDSIRPFVVKSKELNVQVAGTSFNVKAYEEDETSHISLLTGSVKVSLPEQSESEEAITLTPNHQLSYSKETKDITVSAEQGKNAIAWTTGEMSFHEQPFSQLAKDLERKYNIQIHIEIKRLGEEVFTGSFLYQYSINDIIREIDMDKKYHCVWKTGNELIIRDK